MSRRRHWPTPYARGRYRIVALALSRGYAVVDAHGRSPLTYHHPHSGRPVAQTMSLPNALRALRTLTTD